MQKYTEFLELLDKRLEKYFRQHQDYIFCQKGCSVCCEKGDYPLSELELRYIMQGYIALDSDKKFLVQQNLLGFEKNGKCPFLINKECSIYSYRPIICRTHGLAYLCRDKIAKIPYCVNIGLNYKKVYKNGEFLSEPIQENLDTQNLLRDIDYGSIRNLYDWLKP